MVRYLLGDLPADQEAQFEQLFFSDDQVFNNLLAIKESLIDDYLNDNLNEEDRVLFESHFLSSPKHREQVEIARALMNNLADS